MNDFRRIAVLVFGAVITALPYWLVNWAFGDTAAIIAAVASAAAGSVFTEWAVVRARGDLFKGDRSPVTADEAAAIDELAAKAGVTVEVVAAWQSNRKGHQSPVGWFPFGPRRGALLVNDKQLLGDPAVFAAAVAHELGHGYANDHRTTRVMLYVRRAVRVAAVVVYAGSLLSLTAATVVSGLAVGALAGALNRRSERRADRFAVNLVGPAPVASLMVAFSEAGLGLDKPGILDNVLGTHPFTPNRARAAMTADTAPTAAP